MAHKCRRRTIRRATDRPHLNHRATPRLHRWRLRPSAVLRPRAYPVSLTLGLRFERLLEVFGVNTRLGSRSPSPTKRLHDSLDGLYTPVLTLPGADSLVHRCAVHEVIDLLEAQICGDCNRSHDTIPGFSFVTGCRATAVVESAVSNYASLTRSRLWRRMS